MCRQTSILSDDLTHRRAGCPSSGTRRKLLNRLDFLPFLMVTFTILPVERVEASRSAPMRGERRRDFRVEWNSPATLQDNERGLARPCILSSFSNTGAKITGVVASTVPDEFILGMTPGRARNCRVLWRSGDTLGVEFIVTAAKTEDVSR